MKPLSSWPVDAIVAENGAVAFAWESPGKLSKIYQQSDVVRSSNFARMQQVAADIAIDHSEFSHLSPEKIAVMVQIMESVGVANIRRFEAELSHQPSYITPSERGARLSEVARTILHARSP